MPFPFFAGFKAAPPIGYHGEKAIMAIEKEGTCPHCLKPFTAVPRISLLGFQKFTCPHCRKPILYPLYSRIYYWVIFTLLGLIVLLSLAGLSETDGGEQLLAGTVRLFLYFYHRRLLLLIPLAIWGIIRLFGVTYPRMKAIAGPILHYLGLIALVGLALVVLGAVAILIISGLVIPPLIGALLLSAVFSYGLWKDAALKKKLKGIGKPF
jgi:hypothetical protein